VRPGRHIGTKVGTVSAQVAQKTASTVYSGAKTAVSSVGSLLGKLF